MITTLNKLGLEGNYVKRIKGPYMKSPQLPSYSVVKDEKLLFYNQGETRILTFVTSIQYSAGSS